MQRTEAQTPQRIAKLLARAGIASRREIERMIADGRVALNGTVLDTPATVLPSLDGVTVDGEPVEAAAAARLFLFHKPPGYLTAATDPAGRKTIYDALPAELPRLIPVGRLDLNTEGLLLLTTDGELKRQLELPATGVERSYRARAYGQVSQAQLEELIDGIEIEGVRYGKIDANLERRTGANVWIEMTLAEGKNREVRRVLEHLGLRVSRLIRTRYGPFILADLPVGAVGEVRQHDVEVFRKTLKTPAAKRVDVDPVSVDATRAPRPARPAGTERARAPAPADRARAPAPRALVASGIGGARPAPPVAGSRAGPPAVAPRKSRQAPHKPEIREELDTRPPRPEREPRGERMSRPQRSSRTATDTRPPRPRDAAGPSDAGVRPPRAKRPTGWAKAKPKPRPGKPRKPSR